MVCRLPPVRQEFLSIQAQDFIEDCADLIAALRFRLFLSIQAQDFIEDTLPLTGPG